MAKVLVTGMSGTGKSTVLGELGRRGHRAVDTDYGGWVHDVGLPDGSGSERLWHEDRMRALLDDAVAGPLFVSGCVANQSKFYDLFDAVVLLSLPVGALLDRVASRVSNGYGKDPAERERILADLRTVEPLLRRSATAEVDASRPLPEVVELVEAVGLSAPRKIEDG
jgi:broad-specificity NMP kinase